MGNRSFICIEKDNGKFLGIYCHWNGYLTYNGAILYKYYKERKNVETLISLGSLSSLGERIDSINPKTHSFDNQENGTCVFYCRDRNEKECGYPIEVDLEEINNDIWYEYCYVYGLDNVWRYFECGKLKEGLIDLEKGLLNEN